MVDNKDGYSDSQDESLDDFLNAPDEDFQDPFLEDDDSEFVAPKEKQSNSFGKLFKYTAVIALLAGAGYFAYPYVMPSENKVGNEFMAYNNAGYTNGSSMPNAADLNAGDQTDDSGYADVMETPGQENSVQTISEALDFIDNEAQVADGHNVEKSDDADVLAELEKMFPSEEMPAESVESVDEQIIVGDAVTTPNEPMINAFENMDQITAKCAEAGASDCLGNASDAPVIENDAVEIESNENIVVTEVPEEPVVEVSDSEEVENVTDVLKNDFANIPEDSAVDTVEEPRTPIIEDVADEVDVVSEKPAVKQTTQPKTPAYNTPTSVVPVKKAEPAGYRINNAQQLSDIIDPRIQEGRAALSRGDFMTANRIFASVLASDPTNIYALTGKQMAASNIRVNADAKGTAPSAPQTQQPITEPMSIDDIVVANDGLNEMPETIVATAPSSPAATQNSNPGQKPARLMNRTRYSSDITRAGQASSASGVIVERNVAVVDADQAPTASEIIRSPEESSTTDLLKKSVAPREIISMPADSLKSSSVAANANVAVSGALPTGIDRNPSDARGALALAEAYAKAGQKMKALDWYREALRFDALYNTGLDRLAVYDAMALLQ